MTRVYAPNPSQQVLDPLTGHALAGRTVTFWPTATGGVQVTGLLDMTGASLPGSSATTDTYGLFGLQDPANTLALYADAGYERVLLSPTDLSGRLLSVESTVASNVTSISTLTTNVATATTNAGIAQAGVNSINSTIGQPSGIASLDSSGHVPAAQASSSTRAFFASASSSLALSTSVVDIPGATVTFTTAGVNTPVIIIACFDMSVGTGIDATATGIVNIDTVDQVTPRANFDANVTDGRATVSCTFVNVLAAAGSHTIKLRGVRSTSTNTHSANGGTNNGTGLSVIVLGA